MGSTDPYLGSQGRSGKGFEKGGRAAEFNKVLCLLIKKIFNGMYIRRGSTLLHYIYAYHVKVRCWQGVLLLLPLNSAAPLPFLKTLPDLPGLP